jgi:Flp pilus assembly protein TadD
VADSEAARLDDAHRLLSAGRPGDAVGLLNEILERRPNDVRALWMRAEINIRRGRFEVARSDLEAALSIDPGQPGILHALGGVCHALGDHEAAESHLLQATAVNPQDARLWYSLGLVCHGAGRYQAALRAYDHALTVDPGMSVARLGQQAGSRQGGVRGCTRR